MRDEERLVRSLDGDLSEEEASELRDRLVDDRELAARRDAWEAVRGNSSPSARASSPDFEIG